MNLDGRVAVCPYCLKERASHTVMATPFFRFMGPGNGRYCDHCPWAPIVHDETERQAAPHVARHWVPHAFDDTVGRPTDSFYCGCRGWD